MSSINESFDSPPYQTELVRKDGSFNYEFMADSGETYRVQFYPSNGLGNNVRRVYLGHKKGSIFKDVMTKLEDPLRIVATMLAAFAEFQATPTGKSTDGFVIDATVKAFGPTIRLMKRLAARTPAIKSKFNILETNYTWDTSRSPIWVYRKGSNPQEVFNGKNVDTSALVGGKPAPHKVAPEAPVLPAEPNQTDGLASLQQKWAGKYHWASVGDITLNVGEVYKGKSFNVHFTVGGRDMTDEQVYYANQSDIERANDILKQLKGIAATLGFETHLSLCVPNDRDNALGDNRNIDGATIGGSLTVLVK